MVNETIYPPCKKCGASHGMGIEEMSTGIIKPIDLCYNCLFFDFSWRPIENQVELKDINELKKILKETERKLFNEI